MPTENNPFSQLPDSAQIKLALVCVLFGISKATVWRWSKDGRLPKPRKLSPGVTRWNVGEIRAVLKSLGAV
jgi:predicted DNA-binding transcriptional regulator AlpA